MSVCCTLGALTLHSQCGGCKFYVTFCSLPLSILFRQRNLTENQRLMLTIGGFTTLLETFMHEILTTKSYVLDENVANKITTSDIVHTSLLLTLIFLIHVISLLILLQLTEDEICGKIKLL